MSKKTPIEGFGTEEEDEPLIVPLQRRSQSVPIPPPNSQRVDGTGFRPIHPSSFRPPSTRQYARSSSATPQIPDDEKLIFLDWDGTFQETIASKAGEKSPGLLGPFNMALIAELSEHVRKGGVIAITSAGSHPDIVRDIIGINDPLRFTKELRYKYLHDMGATEEQVIQHFEDHPDVKVFLEKIMCFCSIRKGYTDDHPDCIWEDSTGSWERRPEIGYIRDHKTDISLLGVIESHRGRIRVYEDDYNGQTFVEQLIKLDVPKVTFELHNKAFDGVGTFYNIKNLPWPVNMERPGPPLERTPSPRLPDPAVHHPRQVSFFTKLWGCCTNVD